MKAMFRIARNPDGDSTLPYVPWVPVAPSPLVLEAKGTWPRTAKVDCHRSEWPEEPDRFLGAALRFAEEEVAL